MKSISHLLRNALLLSVFTISASCTHAFAYQWKVAVIPAELNTNKTIRLVGGEVQEMGFALQADKEVTEKSANHNIVLEWNLPTGMSIVGNGGAYKMSDATTKTEDERSLISFQTEVANKRILGAPGGRLRSEWQNQSLFVRVPKSVAVGQDYVQAKLIDGDYNKTFKWPLTISTFAPPVARPKNTPIGLWDYSYGRATSEAAAAGVAQFFKDSGVSWVEKASDETYRKALRADGILTAGATHHDYFYKKEYTDYNAAGVPTRGFPNPQAIIGLPKDAAIPGAIEMAKFAKEGNGVATLDYEPTGNVGFAPVAIAAFQKQYNVSNDDFETFQKYVAKNGLKTFESADPLISKTWRQWTQFRTAQASNYVRRLREALKTQDPSARLGLTPSRSYGANNPSTLALGTDNSAMAKYTDIIMPQIYSGYGDANAKLAMRMTAGWRDQITQQKSQSQLWPLLLVRYAGASVSNSPQRVRQQIIGSLANGADGIMLYYPGMMDAPYWEMLARTNEDIAKYEDYYHKGKRVDGKYALSQLPLGQTQVIMYPGYPEKVDNPGWAFSAHQLGSKVLLTLINLQEANDLVFDVDIKKATVLSSENVTSSGEHQWLVAPGKIGFIVID